MLISPSAFLQSWGEHWPCSFIPCHSVPGPSEAVELVQPWPHHVLLLSVKKSCNAAAPLLDQLDPVVSTLLPATHKLHSAAPLLFCFRAKQKLMAVWEIKLTVHVQYESDTRYKAFASWTRAHRVQNEEWTHLDLVLNVFGSCFERVHIWVLFRTRSHLFLKASMHNWRAGVSQY